MSLSSVTDLFGMERFVKPQGKLESERATLLRYFLDNARDRKGALAPARMGMMLSHLSIQDLYYLKSLCQQEHARSGGDTWNKVFWSSLKIV